MAAGKFEVANVTLHTLVNTYPESKYAGPAKRQLLDRRILATCGQQFSVPDACDEAQMAAAQAHE